VANRILLEVVIQHVAVERVGHEDRHYGFYVCLDVFFEVRNARERGVNDLAELLWLGLPDDLGSNFAVLFRGFHAEVELRGVDTRVVVAAAAARRVRAAREDAV